MNKNLNLNNLSVSRSKRNANLPTAIYMMEGDDFRSSRLGSRNNPYEINLYDVIEDAINEGLISITTNGTTSVLTNNGNGTFTHNNGNGVLTTFREGRSTVVNNGNGTYTLTTSDGNTVTLNNNTLTSFVNLVAGNRIATYNDELGNTTDINETVTSMSANANQLEYVDENGDTTIIDLSLFIDDTNLARIVNGTLDPNTFIATFTRDDATTFTVDFSALFSNAPKSRVDVLIGGGNTVAQHDDGTGVIANIQETITNLVDNGNGTFTYTNELEVPVTFSGSPQTVTTLVDNGDGTFTYTSEDNSITTVDYNLNETITLLQDNGDGSFSYTNENGDVTTYTVPETITNLNYNAGTGEISYTNEAGSTVTFSINNNTSVVTPTVTGKIIATHNDGDGNTVNIQETVTTFVDNGNGTYTYTNENGVTTTTTAPGQETVTTLSDNGNDTFTYTSENGTVTTVDYGFTETVTTLVDNLDNTYTYTNENGVAVTFDTSGETITTFVDNGNGSFTYTSEDGTVTTIPAPTPETVTTLVNNGNGTFTYTNENGVTTLVNFGETITSLVNNGDGTYTYTNEDAVSTVITVPEQTLSIITNTKAGNLIARHNDGTGNLVDIDETITSIELDGTDLNYTAEDGVETVIDLSSIGNTSSVTILATGHPIAQHNNGNGTLNTINETITSLAFDSENITFTDEEGNDTTFDLTVLQRARVISGALSGNNITFTRTDASTFDVDISALITSPSVIDQTVPGNQIARHNDGDGNITLINETITTLGFAGSTLTYTDETGTPTALDLSSLSNTQERIESGTLDVLDQEIDLVRGDLSEVNIDISALFARQSQVTGISVNPVDPIIATHTSANGVVVNIRETLTDLSLNGGNLEYTKEDGTTDVIDTSTFGSRSVVDNTIAGNRIARHQDGNGLNVDIDETITSLVLVGSNLIYTREGGTSQTIDMSAVGPASTYTNIVLPINQHGIGTHNDGNGNSTTIYETNTTLTFASDEITYTNERGNDTVIDLTPYTADKYLESVNLNAVSEELEFTMNDAQVLTVDVSDLFDGSTSSINGIVPGHSIAIHNDGNGTATSINETITTLQFIGGNIRYTDENGDLTTINGSNFRSKLTNTFPTGHRIATHNDGVGNLQDINETITVLDLTGNTLTYTDENGDDAVYTLPSAISNTSVITNTVAGHRIATHDDGTGSTVDIDETVTSIGLVGNILTYTDENGDDTDLTLPTGGGGGATSSMTQVVGTGNVIATHNNGLGNTTNIIETVTSISISGSTLTYTDENGDDNDVTLPSGGGGGRSGIYTGATSNTSLAIPGGFHSIVWESSQASVTLNLVGSPSNGDCVEVIRLLDNGFITFPEPMIDVSTAGSVAAFTVNDSTISRFIYNNGTWYCYQT